jgi:hypothetical protein
LDQVLQQAQAYGIAPAQFQAYADQRWGRGWRLNAFGRAQVLEELQRQQNDPKGYADKIECALREAS